MAEWRRVDRAHWLPVVAALALLTSSVRCSTDHEQLAERPGTSGSGVTGLGGNTSATNLTGSVASTTTGTGGTVHYPPDGQDVLTLVHGQVDAERIAFCLARVADDREPSFDAAPIPEGGLGYGETFTLGESEALDFEADDLRLVVLAGEFDADAECADSFAEAYWPARLHEPNSGQGGAPGTAGAGGGSSGAAGSSPVERPPLRALELPTIPANSLVLGRHYVMVLTGCMGGPGVVDDGLHCGRNHSPQTPSLRPVLVPVSRKVEPGRLTLQFMHASAATPSVDIQSVPVMAGTGLQLYLATGITFGRIVPTDPQSSYSINDLGVSGGAELVVSSADMEQFRTPWSEVPGSTEIAEEGSYLTILLGPTLGSSSADGFNESRLTLLATGIGKSE